MSEAPKRLTPAQRMGKRIAIGFYGLIVSSFVVISSLQILDVVWFPKEPPSAASCREGLKGLVTSLGRARSAAAREKGGERAALEVFRRELLPEWGQRPGLEKRCSSDRAARDLLAELDQLRYAEEHAVRYVEVDLGPRRRRVLTLQGALFGATVEANPTHDRDNSENSP